VTLTCEYQLAVEYQLEDLDGISETELQHSFCQLRDGMKWGKCGVIGPGKGFSKSCKGSKKRNWDKKERKERLLG
jgi:hypothetical protein